MASEQVKQGTRRPLGSRRVEELKQRIAALDGRRAQGARKEDDTERAALRQEIEAIRARRKKQQKFQN